MSPLSFALLGLFHAAASAHSDGLHGVWQVESVTTPSQTLHFPEAFSSPSQQVIWGRWLWVFDHDRLTLATQLAIVHSDDYQTKTRSSRRDADYSWCEVQLTVPLNQHNGWLTLPPKIQVDSRSGAFTQQNEPISVASCNIHLSGVEQLHQVPNAAGLPVDRITLQNTRADLSFVLHPAGPSRTLSQIIPDFN